MTISQNGKYIVSNIGESLIVLNAYDGSVISTRQYQRGGEAYKGLKSLLINSAGTEGYVMDKYISGNGAQLFRYNPNTL